MKNTLEFLKRFGFIIFNVVLLIILGVMFARAQTPAAGVKGAMRLLDIGQTRKAVDQMNRAVAESPDAATLYYYLGYAQLQAGDNEAASQSFEKGIARNEKEPLPYAGKGHFLFLKKDKDAGTWFERALTMSKSRNVAVMQAIARAYLTDPKFSRDAIALLEKAKAIEPNNAETFALAGDAYLQQNDGGSAVSNYEWAAQYDPTNAKGIYKVGTVYLKTKDYKIAEESFLKAISIDSEFAPAYEELAELSYLSRNGPQAVKYYETFLSLSEDPEKGKARYAFFLFMAKDFTKANEFFGKMVGKEDVKPLTLRYFAFSLFEAGDFAQSRDYFERYFAKATKQEFEPADYGYYGKLLLKLNEDSLATVNLQKSLALDKNQPELLRLLAETQLKRKKYPETIEVYKQLIQGGQKPLSQDFYSLGRAYYFNSQFAEADSSFQKLIELQPKMVVGYLWEARTKSNLDPETESGLAKPYYEKLIEMAAPTPEKNKNDLIEAYSYLGYYHFLKREMQQSKSYWTKVLALNPSNEKAKEAIKAIN